MIIYEAYNKTNGKSYIGLTTNTLDYRRKQHVRTAKAGKGSHFGKALRKYGEDSFEWYEILRCSSLEDLYRSEMLIISLFEDDQTYNCSLGGEHSAYGLKHSDETKRICGEYGKKRWDGRRASDTYPPWVFELKTYREAREYGVPKTTWYRERKKRGINIGG